MGSVVEVAEERNPFLTPVLLAAEAECNPYDLVPPAN